MNLKNLSLRYFHNKKGWLKIADPEVIVTVISGFFFLLFLYAAASKLLDYQKFTIQLGQSPVLTGYAGIIAWLIPAIEILICALLIIPRVKILALYASFSLMLMFTAYIFIILNFAERVPCSCGGILDKMGWTEHLIFNCVFVVLGIIGIVLQTNLSSQHHDSISEPHYRKD